MMNKKISRIAAAVCPGIVGVGLIVCGVYQGISVHEEYKKGRDEYIYAQVHFIESDTEETETAEVIEEKKVLPEGVPEPPEVKWTEVKAANQHIIAWLQIPVLDLSYPVLQGEDNQFYLHHDMYRQELFAGSIFLDAANDPDFQNYNSIIYGHNMRDGSMFAKLKDLQNEQILQKCPYFWVITPEENLLYQICAVYNTHTGSETYTIQFGDVEKYKAWMRKMQGQSTLDVWDGQTEKIVTLSTCTGDKSTRQVVQGIQIE